MTSLKPKSRPWPATLLGLLAATLASGTSPCQSVSPTFGERAARRAAFDERDVLAAIRSGLTWLRLHQDEDGRWDSDGFHKHDGTEPTDGEGSSIYDVGLTGLALLALLAEDDPVYTEAIARGTDWLVKQQRRDTGRFRVESHEYIYDQAVATLALVEAYALTGKERWKNAAVAGLGYLANHRNPGAAWRYERRRNDNDSSITSWCLAVAASALHAGLDVPHALVAEPLAWLDTITDPVTAHCGYTRAGEPSARLSEDDWKRFPLDRGHALTAAALHGRLLVGRDPEEPLQQSATQLILTRLPRWDTEGSVDVYYWFHASQALAHMGPEHRDRWNDAVRRALMAGQREDGNYAGSWDPIGPWGQLGGRIYATTLAVLSLQAPYRHGAMKAEAQIPDTDAFRRVHGAWRRGRPGEAAAAADRLLEADLDDEDRARLPRVLWYLKLEQAMATKVLDDLRAQADPDYTAVMRQLEDVREKFRGTPTGDRATAEIARLERDPAISHELEAGRRLLALRRRYDPDKPQQRRALLQQLRGLIAKYQDTKAAQEARGWISSLR